MGNENKTIRQELEDVANDFCVNYCKWPLIYNEQEHDGIPLDESGICGNCPCNRLA